MSYSHEWFEYHLTPQEWIEGSESLDFVGLKEKPVPNTRVLSLRFHERMSSGYSPMEKYYHEHWRHEDGKLVRDLINKYGEIPERYRKANYEKR